MLLLECDREDDGRWIAEATVLPGVIVYGATRQEAVCNAEGLARRVIADRRANNEEVPEAIQHLAADN